MTFTLSCLLLLSNAGKKYEKVKVKTKSTVISHAPLVYTQFMQHVFRKTGEEDNLTSACKRTASKMFLFLLNLERNKELAKSSPAPKSPTKQEKQFGEDVQKGIRRAFFLSLISSS